MPLPNDEKLIALSEEILKQFEAMFGPHSCSFVSIRG